MSTNDFTLNLLNEYSNKEYNKEFESSMMETLLRDQKYDLVLLCLKKGFFLTRQIFDQIIATGDIQLYQFLFTDKWPLTLDIVYSAIKSGNLETVQWIFARESSFQLKRKSQFYRCLILMTTQGHLEILQWFRSRFHSRFTQNTIHQIVRKSINCGHLHILNWFRTLNENLPIAIDDAYKLSKEPETTKWIEDNKSMFKYYDYYTSSEEEFVDPF